MNRYRQAHGGGTKRPKRGYVRQATADLNPAAPRRIDELLGHVRKVPPAADKARIVKQHAELDVEGEPHRCPKPHGPIYRDEQTARDCAAALFAAKHPPRRPVQCPYDDGHWHLAPLH